MTKKRFQVYKVSGNFGEWEVEDIIKDTVVMDKIMHKYLADNLCDVLNELSEENEQLKSRIDDYNIALKRLQDLTDRKLKENEQLKQEVDDLKQALIRCAFDER